MAEKLAEYRAKRNFAATPEPSDRAAGPAHRRPIFVVQKHEARRLHYDFRLEIDGELKSWAVTRGPSWDPADKRLAVQVEDHPLAYAEFEGVIPPGQYGGGTVMLWDRGHWRPQGDVAAGLAAGKLGLWLEGERLRGGWTLIRMAGRGRRDNWLLVKDRDEAAEPGRSAEDEGDAATSVKTGRRMAEIAGKAPLRPASPAKPASAKPAKPAKPQPDAAAGAALPDFVAPQLATLVEAPPEGPGWLHEVKLDGYRALLRLDRGRATLLTRRNQDWTVRFRSIAEAAAGLPAETALLDGEVVATDRHGVTSFAALQDALSRGDLEALGYTAFDLIHLDGRDIGALPLVERKAALKALIEGQPGGAGRIAYSEHFEGGGPQALDRACRLALEGTVSKRGDQG
ncbi:MAG TPA: DNA polymerase ligase N-terminal domain-containing protein, partial [Alphaproteobacteria bacterium]|nr:DNA polymerase ligase N-terminal domain-containing protein [Alphaproteobacteria bacterium]